MKATHITSTATISAIGRPLLSVKATNISRAADTRRLYPEAAVNHITSAAVKRATRGSLLKVEKVINISPATVIRAS